MFHWYAFVKEAKVLLGKEVLADTRAETKRRQASATAKKTAEKTKAKGKRKPALKRLGTMAKTATVSIDGLSIWIYFDRVIQEGKAYVKRTGKKAARKRTGGRQKKSSK